MFNAEENDGSKHVVQDVLSVSTPDSHNQLLRENQKLKQELAEAREELKRLKEVLGGKEEHKKTMEQDAEFHVRYWQPEEHQRFLAGLKMYGHKDVKAIARFVGTRNATQVRTHAQKYFLKLEKHGKTFSEMGLPERPEPLSVPSISKAQGLHTPTDETGRKGPSMLGPDQKRQKIVGAVDVSPYETQDPQQQGGQQGGGLSMLAPAGFFNMPGAPPPPVQTSPAAVSNPSQGGQQQPYG